MVCRKVIWIDVWDLFILSPKAYGKKKNSKKFIYYKLREPYIINCGSFVLLQIGETFIINLEKSVITDWARCYYKVGQAFGEQLLLQIGTTIILRIKIYCKLEQVR